MDFEELERLVNEESNEKEHTELKDAMLANYEKIDSIKTFLDIVGENGLAIIKKYCDDDKTVFIEPEDINSYIYYYLTDEIKFSLDDERLEDAKKFMELIYRLFKDIL